MPILKTFEWSRDRRELCEAGIKRVDSFCKANQIPAPEITVTPQTEWKVGACAYYRPNTNYVREWTNPGINICVEECQYPCGDLESRNWTWPGSVTDREPYGVLAHELGHHCDWWAGEKKGTYFSEYGEQVMTESGERPITSYCPNPSEWFAEMFRLFVTNHGLLRQIRPRTYEILLRKWKPVGTVDWKRVLGANVPTRILRTLVNKGAKL